MAMQQMALLQLICTHQLLEHRSACLNLSLHRLLRAWGNLLRVHLEWKSSTLLDAFLTDLSK